MKRGFIYKAFLKSFSIRVMLLLLSQIMVVATLMAASLWTRDKNPYSVKENYAIGDTIIIQMNEIISLSLNMDQQFNEKVGINGSAGGTLNFLPSFSPSKKIGTKANSKFVASHKLDFVISAQVESIDSNGEIFLRASKIVQINNNQDSISISGYVMPRDIKHGRVLSSQLKDAVISVRSDYLKNELNIPSKVLAQDESASNELSEQDKQDMIITFINKLLGEFFK